MELRKHSHGNVRSPVEKPEQNRSLTRESTWSGRSVNTLARRFEGDLERFQSLLDEAIVLANEAAQQEAEQTVECGREQENAATRDDRDEMLRAEDQRLIIQDLQEMQNPRSHSIENKSDPQLSPTLWQDSRSKVKTRDHGSVLEANIICQHREVLGMHSGNFWMTVPQRLSSLNAPRQDQHLEDSQQFSSSRSKSCEVLRSIPGENLIATAPRQMPLQQRDSSLQNVKRGNGLLVKRNTEMGKPRGGKHEAETCSLDGASEEFIDFNTQYNAKKTGDGAGGSVQQRLPHSQTAPPDGEGVAEQSGRDFEPQIRHGSHGINLRGRSHVSIRAYQAFSLARSYRRQPIARDWSPGRKRFVAAVACISTALIGILIGIYAGLVPSIQYYIADFDHYAIIGNVVFYLGMAIPTFFFWPLPLLHGRKPYILAGLAIAMPLLFPQAITVSARRSPYTSQWRWALLLSRAVMGATLGFASMNFHSILTDLFGASLMSDNPHQEVVDKFDVRRHGGGMGVWLGIWTWCFIGSLGVGFLLGAVVINSLNPSWGFYISIILIAVVLFLNVLCPEVRRSAYRRSVAEVRNGTDISRRVARGEIMMHRVKDGPKWWGEEVYHGMLLSLKMLRQPGFAVMAVYEGWIYAQVVLIIVLLGSLTSQSYQLRSPLVGLCVVGVAIGAAIGVPFQKANIFSRARTEEEGTNAATMAKSITWTSHLVRRTIFTIVLPLAGIAYAAASSGPPIPVAVPAAIAALVGNLSCLAISECNGLLMETFDTSDLQPGMTGRARGSSVKSPKRTNYSSFPRVTAGFAVSHTIGFVLAAGATGLGGMAQRNIGQQASTGVVAGVLLILSLLLLGVLLRFKEFQIIPTSKTAEMDKWIVATREHARRRSVGGADGRGRRKSEDEAEAEPWRPLIIGNPSSKKRRVNVLELGALSRFTEIRKKNRLIDQGIHLNRAALDMARDAVEDAIGIGAMASELARKVSQRSMRRYHSGSPVSGEKVAAADIAGPSATAVASSSRLGGGDRSSSPASGSAGSGVPYHGKTPGAGEGFAERECVMGQTVVEEREDYDLEAAEEAEEALEVDVEAGPDRGT